MSTSLVRYLTMSCGWTQLGGKQGCKLRFHIRYPEEKIPEPILYQIGHEYQVVTSIRRADVRETTGWLDVEFSGEVQEIERAIEGLRQKKLYCQSH